MTNKYTTLSFVEKLGYGMGDGACNIIWQTIMLFMAYFYTDVYGLNAVHMGIMFLVVRALDAVVDVAVGFVADRTRTPLGQFRPYLLWFCIPFGVLGALTFYTPDLGENAKIVYAYVTYSLLSLTYSAINVPYCAMINNLSRDPKERVSLQSFRFAFAALGGIIVSLVAMPLVKTLGHGNDQLGYFYSMIIMGGISVVMFLLCFLWTRERYISAPPIKSHKRYTETVFADLRVLMHHSDWLRLFTLNVVNLIAGILKTGMAIYFVTYYLGRPDLISLVLGTILVSKLVGSVISPLVFKHIDRVQGYKLAMCVQAVLMIVLFFIDAHHLWLICGMISLVHIINASATPLQWSLLSDVIDDIEKNTAKNLSGLVFSTNLFAIKVGIAIGGAFIGWVLAFGGYIGKAPIQTEEALLCIRLLFTVIPALLIVSLIWVLRHYSLTDRSIQSNGADQPEPRTREMQDALEREQVLIKTGKASGAA
ncbi:UNVERIFIED_ORG: sugar (glycoside-pentoside-hexuronide) transporter [Pseudomonas lini]|jgi:GPH family glycoside/pentoside/hexuronide:cation symporter